MVNDSVSIETVSWEQLQQYVYYVDGSWRDIYVLDAGRADWEIWTDFVNANYRDECSNGDEGRFSQIDFATVENCWDGNGHACMPCATFFVGDINVKCHFFGDYELENDIDPKTVTSYAVHQQRMNYLMRLSHALRKEVVLTPENDTPATCSPHWAWQPLLAVNGEQLQVHPCWLDPKSHQNQLPSEPNQLPSP